MRVGQRRRRDQNESVVVLTLRRIGVAVTQISAPGLADLLCHHEHTGYFMVEVKSQTGTLTDAQVTSRPLFPFHIARTEQQALDVFFHNVRRYK